MRSAGHSVAVPASPAHPRSARVRRHRPASPADPSPAMLDAHDVFPEPQVLRCGDLVLDESRWTVHRAGTLVDLSPTEFRLLACLLRHQGSVLSRAELLEHVWGHGYTGQSQVVETYVSYLRRKLHRLGPSLIHTRRGAGYLLCASPGGAPADMVPEAAAFDLGTPDLGTPDLGTPDLGAPYGPAAGGPHLADG